MKGLIISILLLFSVTVYAQFGDRDQDNEWDASWVYVPESDENDPGLYLFRKTINLESVPEKFEVRVSADNRYKLFVNERLVSLGPALGDIENWNYETVDLAPYLRSGDNIVVALVWNEGSLRPVFQFSYRTGFIMQGIEEETKVLNSNDSWKCIEDKSYEPISQTVQGYYAAGAGDKIDMNLKVKDWKTAGFDDSNWKQAKPVFESSERGLGFNTRGGWTLQSSVIPPMELTPQRLVTTRKAEGATVPKKFPAEKAGFEVPANTTAKILLDQTYLTNAYPTLIFSGGKNSTIVITYSEGLYDEEMAKNNRNEIEGKTISGRLDSIISDGSKNQSFTTLRWRTYRYVELKVEAQDSPLTIEDFYGTYTGYPFEMKAKIFSDNSEVDKILENGWRTARLCGVETYMDNPYYERLQYIGDTRIQMMISYYNSGDDRLGRNAINLINNSRQPNGYTLSRYPDRQSQIIAPFSLWYIGILYDYLLYRDDPEFLKDKLLGARQILNYFISYTDEDGSLKNLPGWTFTDWAEGWRMGIGPMSEDGSSALLDFQLLLALQAAIELESTIGSNGFAALYTDYAQKITQTIKSKYWDPSSKLFADTPDKDSYSQHTNSMAILSGLVEGNEAKQIGELMLSDTSLTETSIYFKYYLHLALVEAGLGDHYLDWLDVWRRNIELGLTTWGETSEVETTRSDCHAWGASPNIEAYRIILGIESDAPYFKKVKIEPHLGDIEKISGEMPHPEGSIAVNYEVSGEDINAEINLPEGIDGTFVWNGKSFALEGGGNIIKSKSELHN